jgi:hypothetical protein
MGWFWGMIFVPTQPAEKKNGRRPILFLKEGEVGLLNFEF